MNILTNILQSVNGLVKSHSTNNDYFLNKINRLISVLTT